MEYDQTKSRGQLVARYGQPFTAAARVTCGLGAVVLAGNAALGQTWDGEGPDNNWGTGANWTSNFVPPNNGTATLIFTDSTQPTPTAEVAWSLQSIAFDAGATVTFTVSGNPLTFSSGGSITNNSAVAQIVQNVLNADPTGLALTGNTGLLTVSGAVNLGAATLTLGGANGVTVSGVVSGSGGILKSGEGRATLSGANTFTGPVILNQGTLVLGNDAALGSTTSLTIAGGNLEASEAARTIANTVNTTVTGDFGVSGNQNLTVAGGMALTGSRTVTVTSSGTTEFTGVLSGDGASLTKAGSGGLTLRGVNTYDGETVVSEGTLTIAGAGGATPAASVAGDARVTGGVLIVNGRVAGDVIVAGGAAALAAANAVGGNATISGGTLVLAVGDSVGGDVTISGGTLALGADNAVSGNLNIAGGALAASGAARTIANTVNTTVTGDFGVSGSQSLTVAGDVGLTATRTVNVTTTGSASAIFSGQWSGEGGITKTGDGRMVLSGANTFTGPVTVSGGTLALGNDAALGAGNSLTIGGGGKLEAQGNNRLIADEVTVTVAGDFGATGSENLTIASDIELGETRTIDVAMADEATLTLPGDISGEGDGITKTGSGRLLLRGNNTYSGPVTISGGTFSLGSNAALGNSTSLTLAGGSLEAADASRVIGPAVAVAVTGDFEIIGSQNLEIAGGVAITGARTVTVTDSGATEFSGVLSGEGASLTKAGTGALTLSGVNTYAGETAVTGGTLTIAGAEGETPAGSVAGDVRVTGGTLEVDGMVAGDAQVTGGTLGVDGTVAGNLAVSGGTASLGAEGAVGQDATVSGGTLVLGAQNALAGSVTVTGGTLAFGADDGVGGSITVSGGSLEARGETAEGETRTIAKNLTINDDFSVSGSQNILFSGDAVLNADRRVTVSNTGQTTFAGVLSGAGGLIKAGSRSLMLSGVNTYTGETVVTGGTLTIAGAEGETPAGSLAGDARVTSGTLVVEGRLEGNALVSGSSIFGGSGVIGGNVSLGAGSQLQSLLATTVSRMSIDGDLTMEDGSTMYVRIGSATEANRVDVGGVARLDGRLAAEVAEGSGYTPRRDDRFEILTADGGIEGGFDSTLSLTASLEVGFEIVGNSVVMTVEGIPFLNSAVSENQVVIAGILDVLRGATEGEVVELIDNLEIIETDDGLRAALDQLVPEEVGALSNVSFATMQWHAGDVSTRLAEHRVGYVPEITGPSVNNLRLENFRLASKTNDPQEDLTLLALVQQGSQWAPPDYAAKEEKPFEFFVAGSGTFGEVDESSSGAGYDFLTGQVTAGLDRKFGRNAVGGFLLGYDQSTVDVGGDGGEADVSSLRLGVYGSMYGKMYRRMVFVNAYVGGGYHFYQIDRKLQFAGFSQTASAEPEGLELDAMGEFGFEIPFEKTKWNLYPVVTVIYNDLSINDYTESGAGAANLTVEEQNARSFLLRPGVRLSGNYKLENKTRLLPEFRVAYQHDFHDPQRSVTARLAAGGGEFAFDTADLGQDSAVVGAGLTVVTGGGWSVFGNYNAELGRSDYLVQNLQLGLQVRF